MQYHLAFFELLQMAYDLSVATPIGAVRFPQINRPITIRMPAATFC